MTINKNRVQFMAPSVQMQQNVLVIISFAFEPYSRRSRLLTPDCAPDCMILSGRPTGTSGARICKLRRLGEIKRLAFLWS